MHNGHERRGQHFTAPRVRILKIDVDRRTLGGRTRSGLS
jgi:hypothetical protein